MRIEGRLSDWFWCIIHIYIWEDEYYCPCFCLYRGDHRPKFHPWTDTHVLLHWHVCGGGTKTFGLEWAKSGVKKLKNLHMFCFILPTSKWFYLSHQWNNDTTCVNNCLSLSLSPYICMCRVWLKFMKTKVMV